MHQAGPTLWVKFTEYPQKYASRIRKSEIFGRYTSSQQKEVYPLHQEADAGF
jgi:hypothetical protein